MEINGEKPGLRKVLSNCKDTPAEKGSTIPPDWMAQIFGKLQARYGHKWVSAYPAGPMLKLALAEWADGLSGYTGEEIKHGLDTWDSDWPPTLPEFKKACRSTGRPQTDTTPEWLSLPRPKPDPDEVQCEIEKMRGMIGRRRG